MVRTNTLISNRTLAGLQSDTNAFLLAKLNHIVEQFDFEVVDEAASRGVEYTIAIQVEDTGVVQSAPFTCQLFGGTNPVASLAAFVAFLATVPASFVTQPFYKPFLTERRRTGLFPVVALACTDAATAQSNWQIGGGAGGGSGGPITAKNFIATTGSILTSLPAYAATQTWNAIAQTFKAILVNITDTASAVGSLLMDLQVGGVSKFTVRKDGAVTAATETLTPPVASSAITVAGVSQTGASAPVADLSQTWNNVATAFTGILLKITDTLSAAGSLLMDLQVGGTSKAKIDKAGTLSLTGGYSPPYATAAGALVLTNANQIVVYTGAGGHTFTLPAANANGAAQSIKLTIKCSPAAGGNLTVSRAGADTINSNTAGNTTLTLTPGQSVDLNSNGVSLWEVT